MRYILLLLLPPLACARYQRNQVITFLCLFLYAASVLLFIFYSVLFGLAVFLTVSAFSFIATSNKNKLKYDDKKHYILPIDALTGCVLLFFVWSIMDEHKNFELSSVLQAENDLAQGAQIFTENCAVCHNLDPTPYVGPNLRGVVDREVGSVINYEYSEVLKNSKAIWSHEHLAQYLSDQNSLYPGTRMVIAPLTEQEIKLIIAFLESKT